MVPKIDLLVEFIRFNYEMYCKKILNFISVSTYRSKVFL